MPDDANVSAKKYGALAKNDNETDLDVGAPGLFSVILMGVRFHRDLIF